MVVSQQHISIIDREFSSPAVQELVKSALAATPPTACQHDQVAVMEGTVMGMPLELYERILGDIYNSLSVLLAS